MARVNAAGQIAGRVWVVIRWALAQIARDLHIYGGLILLGWGLRGYPWGAAIVGLMLWYMGVFRLSANRE